jgi:preprotein translocase subunit SecG
METFVWIIHTLAALSVVGLVLIQHGKGADMGAAFGSGSAGSLFGATGASNFLSKTTGVLAAVFFISSLGLTYLSGHRQSGGVMQSAPATVQPVPAPIEKKVDSAVTIPPATPAAAPEPAVPAPPASTPATSGSAAPAATEPAAADSKAKDIPK